jgi:hypothetical protein
MPTVPISYLSLKELRGTASTLEEFHQRLKRFSRSGIVRLCSILNMVLAKWTGEYDFDAHAKLVRSFFPPPVADKIISSKRLVFHRHQIFFVAQEALRHCDEAAREVVPPYWGGIGLVFLMASDHLYSAPPQARTPAEEHARTISEFIPIIEANGFHSFLMKMARSYLMISRFLEPLRGTPGFFDIPAIFSDAARLPLDTYQALLFGGLSRFSRPDAIKQSNNPADFAIPENWFQSTPVRDEHVRAFFDLVSGTSEELAAIIQRQNPQSNDFTILRDKPLFRNQGLAFPLDFSLLAEKFESGPFWKVNSHLPDNQRNDFHSFWGRVFENYMNWLLRQCVDDKSNEFHPDPKYLGRPNEQVCDAVIICGRAAILLEYKGATFTSGAKYGGQPQRLAQEIDRKLVGTPESRKGVRQLAAAIERLCRHENPEGVEGVKLSGVDTIFPVIVTRDDLGSAFGMNAYLNLKFQELISLKRSRSSITPLFCLSADDMEKLSPYLLDTAMSELLSARYKKDKSLRASFFTIDNSVLA